jgi:type IV secretory pathway VirB10-like protein
LVKQVWVNVGWASPERVHLHSRKTRKTNVHTSHTSRQTHNQLVIESSFFIHINHCPSPSLPDHTQKMADEQDAPEVQQQQQQAEEDPQVAPQSAADPEAEPAADDGNGRSGKRERDGSAEEEGSEPASKRHNTNVSCTHRESV